MDIRPQAVAPREPDVQRSTEDFSLVRGGPLYRLCLRTGLARPPLELVRRRMLALVVITGFLLRCCRRSRGGS